VTRQRQLHQHAIYGCICCYVCYCLLQLRLADRLWQADDPAGAAAYGYKEMQGLPVLAEKYTQGLAGLVCGKLQLSQAVARMTGTTPHQVLYWQWCALLLCMSALAMRIV
jgi:hypothetical protein